jgi:hypothetical protein
MNEQKSQNLDWLWWVLGILIFVVVIVAVSNHAPTQPTPELISPTTEQPLLPPTPMCTNFQYSEWAHCATDGTQSRAIIKASPDGCSGGNPIQFQSCKYEALPQGTTFEKIYQRIINQIKNAPNQTITTSYVAGSDAGNTTNLTWQVKDDGFYLYVKAQRTSSPEDQSTMALVDTNFDGQPDWISDRGQPFVVISPSSTYYNEIILSWATFNAYFGSYLLK